VAEQLADVDDPTRYPIYGLPFSVKESVMIKGGHL